MFFNKILFIFILTFFTSKIVLGKEYLFKWYNSAQVLDALEFEDKSKYQITKAEGSWEDSEGNYGFLKCLGPIIVTPSESVELEVFCNGFDHLKNKFSIKLIRKSDYDVGVGEAIYISGTGRYKSLVNKSCKYAIKYIEKLTKGFYRHICK